MREKGMGKVSKIGWWTFGRENKENLIKLTFLITYLPRIYWKWMNGRGLDASVVAYLSTGQLIKGVEIHQLKNRIGKE